MRATKGQTMHGTFVWNELTTKDVEAAKAFYAETLGWTFEEFAIPDGKYWVAKSGDQIVAGLGGMEAGAIPEATESYWFSLIGVDDVDACVEKAVARGATVVRPPVDVPNVGRVAIVRDPTGAAVGWMKGI
ncbi:VOC family protein [Polyangium sp. 15x6]|uniref:VOC family protein n=1 Tax=Polyangium sp. 15x6 TaxID=3042687 RepID=UPI00249B64D1|nr:VOC family protein [Polyangium sp. 15x6]MDI3282766.1 VOC family protein [Polyangium sp. 15x6]